MQSSQTLVTSASLALLVAVAAGGCGSSESTDSTSDSVTIEHAHGTTTISEPPERVVALGSADVQNASALDAPIVGAVTNDYSDDGQWIGVDPPLGDDVETLGSIEPDLEAIAALDPDLILITTAQPGFSEQYDKLEQIAPTVSYRKGILEDSGDDLVTMIGRATGREERAEELIRDSHEASESWRDAHESLDGDTLAFGQFVGGQTHIVVSPTAPSTVFYEQLGLPLPTDLADLPVQAPPGIHTIPDENLDVLDGADHLILGVGSKAEETAFLENPVVAGLDIAEEGRINFVDFDVASAVLAPSPATTPTILDQLDTLLAER